MRCISYQAQHLGVYLFGKTVKVAEYALQTHVKAQQNRGVMSDDCLSRFSVSRFYFGRVRRW